MYLYQKELAADGDIVDWYDSNQGNELWRFML